jgi:hypothetical protein
MFLLLASHSATAAPINLAPVSDPGGPYFVLPGGTVLLDGTGSFDPNGDALTFLWELDSDGQFDDASTPTVLFSPLPGASLGDVYSVFLRVTDPFGLPDVRGTTVIVVPQLPEATAVPEPASLVLIGSGLVGAAASRRSRKKRRAYIGKAE